MRHGLGTQGSANNTESCACEIQLGIILAAGKVEVSFRPTTDREGRTELSPNSSWI